MFTKSNEKVVEMTRMRNFIVWSIATALAVVSLSAVAQDDLDSLLKDLEGESSAKPAAQAAKPAAEEPKAEAAAPQEEAKPVAEEAKPAEEAPAPEEAKPAAEEPKAEVAAPQEEAKPAAEEPKAEEPKAEAAAPQEEKPAVAAAKSVAEQDAELIENIRATEKLRREALDAQAKREIKEARQNMADAEYTEAVRHYGLALKLLNDRQSSKKLRKECDQGIAEGLYRGALQEYDLGRRDRAISLIEKAIDMRHPKARRVLEKWNAEIAKADDQKDLSSIKHQLNDEEYKKSREQIRRHLRRSRQFLAVKDMKRALEECEIVLVQDPYNQDAIRVREAIQRKRSVILEQEREAARKGMIADVDKGWRPRYAIDAAQLKDVSAETVKTQVGEDPERTLEQDIERRMKEMRLPTISFKPPATIIDAVDFFRGASKDYDRPDVPVEKRGFNFVLKTPVGAIKSQAADEEQSDDFSSNDTGDESSASSNGLPPIPTITASDITFHEALKLVCDSVDYKFIVRGSVVMVMPKDMSTAELLSRKYDVLDAFLERMTSASADVKEMKSAGFGASNTTRKSDEGEENQEKDWKGFFEQMGVQWPEGSSIMYIKTLGKLYVRNTRENLAEFEKVLQEMGSQPKLIEIETRFVEVSQEDLNSLGFEWILNSDYSLNVGDKLGRALGISGSEWGTESGNRQWNRNFGSNGGFGSSRNNSSTQWSTVDSLAKNGGKASVLTEDGLLSDLTTGRSSFFDKTGSGSYSDTYQRTVPYNSKNGSLIRSIGGTRTVGINAFGGTDSEYNHGNRYLSNSNFITGENGTNDQFMKVNAFLGSADLSMILHMLSQRSDTDLLSAPKVVTKSGENAVIKVVVEYIYPQDYDVQLQSSSSSSGSSGYGGSGSQSAILAVVEPQNFTMREVGVILDVTPTYSEANGGTIDLELKPQVVDEPIWHNYGMKIPFTGNTSGGATDVAGLGAIISSMVGALESLNILDTLTTEDKQIIGGRVVDSSMNAIDSIANMGSQNMTWYEAPMEQPWFPVRSIDSKVSITPGATVVMGGLIREQRKAMDDKVPFLGDLPFIGRLFRSHAEQTIKKNLLIFVTGRLITPSGRELALNEESSETKTEVKPAPKAE